MTAQSENGRTARSAFANVSGISDERPILVIGGTGKTGRRVVEKLTARSLPVRIGSRSSAPPFDWEEPSTWAPALRSVSAVYLTYYPDLAVPGAVDAVRAVVAPQDAGEHIELRINLYALDGGPPWGGPGSSGTG